MSLPIYSTGTVSVAAGGTDVTGAGVMWSGINVKQGDFISIAGSEAVLITEVTDAANLKIVPWQGAAQSNVAYTIYQNYVGRVVGVAAAEDVGVMLEKLHTDGLPFILGAEETVPDPSYGDEGQLAFKPSTGQWWVKQGGVWVPSAGLTALGYGGTSATPMLIGLSPPPKVFTTQTSLAYNGARVRAASAANLNNWMEGVATYSGTTLTMAADLVNNSGTYSDWLFSIAGTKGQVGNTGPTGPMGPEGPPGATGTGAGNVTGPAGAVHERIAVFNGTSGTIIKDGGKTIAELGAGTIIVGDTPPVGSPVGTLWWESDTGNLYILYNDGSSTQWVMAVPATSAASIGAVAYTPQTPTNDVYYPLPIVKGQTTQARQNIYAAPFDALAYSGMQINGSMEVSQEKGYENNVTASSDYICDGFRIYKSGTMAFAAGVTVGVPVAVGIPGALYTVTTTAQTTIGTGDYLVINHPIEGHRVARLAWGTINAQPITIGFWSQHFRTGIYSISISNAASNRVYCAAYTHNVSGGLQYNVITIPGCTDGVWNTTSALGINIQFVIASGLVAPSANAWHSGSYQAAPGQTNGVASTSDVFRITGVVVLPGIEAPSAERSPLIMRPYDQELVTCQRYYERHVNMRALVWAGYVTNGAAHGSVLYFNTPKRSVPSISSPNLPTVQLFPVNSNIVASINGAYIEHIGNGTGYGYFLYDTIVADARL
jgi:hypothetical protein